MTYGDPSGVQEDRFSPPGEAGSGDSDGDVVTVSRHESMPPFTPAQQALVEKLLDKYVEWLNQLKSIPQNTVFHTSKGDFTAAQLVGMFSLADFVIFPAGYPHGNGIGGAGVADYNGGDPIFGIDIDQLANKMETSDVTAWYFTHELGHITAPGQAHNEAMYQSNSPGGIDRTQSEYDLNEMFANSLSRAILDAAGYTFSNSLQTFGAPGGYSEVVTHTNP